MTIAINCNACLVLLGAIVISANSQDVQTLSQPLRSPVLPEIRQRVWPSFGFRPVHLHENRASSYHGGGEESAREFPTRNWIAGEDGKGQSGFRSDSLNEKPEKLTAVAGTEYMGTRAVAYAGFTHHHHRQHHHHQGHQQRGDFFANGYQQTVTTAPQPAAGVTYAKHHSGRRVCSRQTPSSVTHHHRGRQIRLVYTEFPTGFSCCPGWTQVTRLSFGCNKPACPTTCSNGGTCVAPGKCTCPKQFTGQQCQFDVDECLTEKPCAQLCQNTYGGYKCSCRAGYQLQPDRQSCRKNDSDDTAFEARDLEADYRPTTTRTSTIPQDTENEVGDRDFDKDYEFILKRLAKLEKLVARSKRRDAGATEMSAKINLAVENIGELKRAVESVRIMQQEVFVLRNKLTHIEEESRRMQHIANRMTDLETRLRIYCSGSFHANARGIC